MSGRFSCSPRWWGCGDIDVAYNRCLLSGRLARGMRPGGHGPLVRPLHPAYNGRVTTTTADPGADVLPLSFEGARALVQKLDAELGRVIIGQHEVRREIMICLFAGGHCLLRGVPGLAKTLLIKTLADAIDLRFSRIQFTPDLMPSDILGTEVIEEDVETGRRAIRFIPGPVFANVILADEINRTPPRTQAALLEAMQEYQVTVGGKRMELERPLFVLATENPIEQEGTHPLPEAQLDRFMLNVVMHYPEIDDERRILAETTAGGVHVVRKVATGAELEAARMLVRDMPAAANIVDYALRLIRATRAADASSPAHVRDWVRWGAGPRAGQALVLCAKAAALLDGRVVPSLEDVTSVALPVLRHRVLVNFQAEADGIDPDHVIARLLEVVRP
jgi:MoxR-like ATPase